MKHSATYTPLILQEGGWCGVGVVGWNLNIVHSVMLFKNVWLPSVLFPLQQKVLKTQPF